MIDPASRMLQETLQAPTAVARQIETNSRELERLGARLRQDPPPFAVTVGRGSSDHASIYGKYLIEARCGVVTSSAAPSVITVYGARLAWDRALVLGISQSGESPDVVATVEQARTAGALTVAMVNRDDSPLAGAAEVVLPLCAGPETSVAATKSFITSLAGLASLVAAWRQDRDMLDGISRLPELLERACQLDWSAARPVLVDADDLLVLGRGYSYPIALEAALKLKETCGLHAEAFSGAEVRHGPITLVDPRLPVLVFAPQDLGMDGLLSLASELAAGPVAGEAERPPSRGTDNVFVASPIATSGARLLPVAEGLHPTLDSIGIVQSFYRFAEGLARARGRDPDHPPTLSKVTRTL